MTVALRLSVLWQHLKGSLWVLPALFVLGALALGTLLAQVRPADGTILARVAFGGTASGARDVLSVIAGAMITVIGLSFSLTVVALQMAAGQFSPRVLRSFLEDRGVQAVLSVLLANFAYSMAVIRLIRDEGAPAGEFLPGLAVTAGIALALVAVAALVYFIHHLTQELRPDTIMANIAADTLAVIDKVFPHDAGAEPQRPPFRPPHGDPYRVTAKRSGYLQAIAIGGLVSAAARLEAVVRLRPAVGAHVAEGTTLAWVWPQGDALADEDARRRWRHAVHDHVHVGQERTMQQDVMFGLRQLVDIAAKALSTGMNDPTTAVGAIGHLSRVTCRLAVRDLGDGMHADRQGAVRAFVPAPRMADYLHLACDQPRRYGSDEPAVLVALLDLLADVGEVATSEEQRAVVSRECARSLELARERLDDTDFVRVEAAADLVHRALAAPGRPYPEVEG